MNEPHVETLTYVVEHDPTVNYESASPFNEKHQLFNLIVEDARARFELKKHFSTVQEAQAAVQPFIDQWEFKAFLEVGPGQFALRFDRAKVVDRNPTPGVHSAYADPVSYNISVSKATAMVSRQYPRPTFSGALDINNPTVQTMLMLYESYRRGRDLPVIAYLCYEEFRKLGNCPKDAADRHHISHNLIGELSKIANTMGGDQARHAAGIGKPLSQYQVRLLEKTIEAMIVRAARVFANPNQPMPTIDRGSLFAVIP